MITTLKCQASLVKKRNKEKSLEFIDEELQAQCIANKIKGWATSMSQLKLPNFTCLRIGDHTCPYKHKVKNKSLDIGHPIKTFL